MNKFRKMSFVLSFALFITDLILTIYLCYKTKHINTFKYIYDEFFNIKFLLYFVICIGYEIFK